MSIPRLYDELNSSHLTIHGASDNAIAIGYSLVNEALRFLSPPLNRYSLATYPRRYRDMKPGEAGLVVDKIRDMPRRNRPGMEGFDALGITVIRFENTGAPVTLVRAAPAPPANDLFHYESMIRRASSLYQSRFVQ